MLAFIAVAVVVIVTPGQDTALTVRNTLARGRAAGIRTAFGCICGQLIWVLAASAGLAALLLASEPAFVALKLFGAAYLAYLGLRSLADAVRGVSATHAPLERRARHEFRQGLVSDLGNPKIAVFFTSLLPQFGDTFPALVGLGVIFSAMTFAWLVLYSVAVARAGDLLRKPAPRRVLDAITGTALVALGLRLARTERPV